MFIVTMTKRKAVLAVLILGAVLAAAILWIGSRDRGGSVPTPPSGETNELRLAYLRQLGWEVQPDPVETLELLLPEDDGPWAAYHALQRQQGFDLTPYQGRRVERFTYRVTNYPGHPEAQANLYLCGGAVIGGDLFDPGEDAFQTGLTANEVA